MNLMRFFKDTIVNYFDYCSLYIIECSHENFHRGCNLQRFELGTSQIQVLLIIAPQLYSISTLRTTELVYPFVLEIREF